MDLATLLFLLLVYQGSAVSGQECSAASYTCPLIAPCCSKYGYCGSTPDYCGPDTCEAGCDFDILEKAEEARGNGDLRYFKPIEFEHLVQLSALNIFSGCVNSRHAALTFDDGIHPKQTPKILKILSRHKAKGTFFILGQTISKGSQERDWKKNRQILSKMIRDGHCVGSHTFDHSVITDLTPEDIQKQMKMTEEAMFEVARVRPRFMRAPEG